MKRRGFLASAPTVAATAAAVLSGSRTAFGQQAGGKTQLLELRRYRLRMGPMAARFAAYAKDALVPALGRAGIAPIGAWNVSLGAASPTFHLLLPHPEPESVVTLEGRLAKDAAYARAAEAFLRLPPSDPPFVRCDSSLHATVPTQPGVRKPEGAAAGPARVFELRTYEGPSEPAFVKKVEMFEAGGELALFARLGMHTVFFARDVIGGGLPSLTYMLVFADVAAREKAWAAFRDDAEWVRLRDRPEYADIVSNIDAALLRPTEYSAL
jgi:hypothetical protein